MCGTGPQLTDRDGQHARRRDDCAIHHCAGHTGSGGSAYFARAIFLPLALAILLTFLLAPGVRLLRHWGVPKSPAVILVVAITFIAILGIGGLVAQQVTQLGQKLPEYHFNIEEKISSLRGVASGGTLERISNFLRDINQEIRKKDENPTQSTQQPKDEQVKPIPVEIHQPDPMPMQVIQRVLQPLSIPLPRRVSSPSS